MSVLTRVVPLALAFTLRAADSSAPPPSDFVDPALVRRDLLQKLDARIDAASAKAHLDARLTLDEAMPLPYLGIDSEAVDGKVKVTAVYGLTGAKKAGVKVGDVLLALDGDEVHAKPELGRAIRSRRPGTEVTLRIVRDGQEMKLPCTIGKRPEEDEDEDEQFPDLPPRPAPAATPFKPDFANMKAGEPPTGFDFALGGHGGPPLWVVIGAGRDIALRQESTDTTGIRFPIALATGVDYANVVGRCRFRYIGGEVDKAGGVILRYADPGNYYVARANAAEGDLRIFRVANGLRRTLPDGVIKGASDDDQWHTLEFRAEGSKLTATLDGKFTVTAYDSYFLRGRVGLWTKSDSRTEFADVGFEPIAGAKK
jgi:hypothetical protein